MTERHTTGGRGLEGLEQVLERFGSDRTRWPAPVRRDFAGLLAGDAEAQKRLREAEALDRLLDLAPRPAVETRALADKILAAAEKESPAASPPKARVAWAKFERKNPRVGEAQWPAAALLAASLVLGAFAGLSGTFDRAVDPLVASSTSSDNDMDPAQIAFDSNSISMFEEELL
ncbi:hypothetical protein [Hyphomicrobium sp.]|uniref:hypothetical protein n=1 Tax=Hyphomicrobium sp. TaxID=82 RepID=UPI002E302B31|nr:hypothetical protein [Hyphomicrobium sp.]HEX2843291.1 hypothetical protein [Hyphomicrobium sp.]